MTSGGSRFAPAAAQWVLLRGAGRQARPLDAQLLQSRASDLCGSRHASRHRSLQQAGLSPFESGRPMMLRGASARVAAVAARAPARHSQLRAGARRLATAAPSAAGQASGSSAGSTAVLFAASVGAGVALMGMGTTLLQWPEGCEALVKEFKGSESMKQLFGPDLTVVRYRRITSWMVAEPCHSGRLRVHARMPVAAVVARVGKARPLPRSSQECVGNARAQRAAFFSPPSLPAALWARDDRFAPRSRGSGTAILRTTG